MTIMVIGGGGREHAIIKKLRENKAVTKIYCLPGNGGIAADAECVPVSATDIDGIVDFAKNHTIDFAVVAPDDPLVMGCADRLRELGIKCFGPAANAAVIEGSKAFAKELMKKYSIPTAAYEIFDNSDDALAYLKTQKLPIVIKADGLALGKGVIIAEDAKTAENAVLSIMEDKIFGSSGSKVVIEEFLTGPEVSVLAFTDGETIVPMISSMDHKRVGDGDTGPNTGGMGTVAPNPYYTDEIAEECMKTIFLPTIRAMKAEGRTFSGCLYFGLMLTPNGPRVIEYNCRFGDPETQVILPLLKTDLLTVMTAVEDGKLADCPVEFENKSAACVITASGGYPGSYEKGHQITIDEDFSAELFVAGAKLIDDVLCTSGGRVLGVTATADSLKEALDTAYGESEKIHFKNAYRRTDIGARALKAQK